MQLVQAINLHPTQVAIFKMESDLSELLKDIYAVKESTSHSVYNKTISNLGGWQNHFPVINTEKHRKIVEEQNKCIEEYLKVFQFNSVKYTKINSWVNVNKGADHNLLHAHGGSEISCCLYIKLPTDSDSGVFEIEDKKDLSMLKRDHEICRAYDTYSILPEEGNLIVFPSWMKHRVMPTYSEQDRVSLASNYRVELLPDE